MEPQKNVERYIRNSTKAFLRGKQDLKWIIGVLLNSGISSSQTMQTLQPYKDYGAPGRWEKLFDWLQQTKWSAEKKSRKTSRTTSGEKGEKMARGYLKRRFPASTIHRVPPYRPMRQKKTFLDRYRCDFVVDTGKKKISYEVKSVSTRKDRFMVNPQQLSRTTHFLFIVRDERPVWIAELRPSEARKVVQATVDSGVKPAPDWKSMAFGTTLDRFPETFKEMAERHHIFEFRVTLTGGNFCWVACKQAGNIGVPVSSIFASPLVKPRICYFGP